MISHIACMKHFIGVLFCLLAAGEPSFSQEFNEALDQIRSEYNLTGLAAAATCQGTPVETYYGGVRNLQSGAPLNEDTYFRIASVSKAFTAAALLRLSEAGAFQLDDDVSDALGYLLRNPNHPTVPITYRMLLNHTASIQDGTGYSGFLGATTATDDPPSVTEILLPGGTFYTANMWRLEVPGTHFAYSNMTYGMIGTLVEVHANMRFDQFVNSQVLEPLGIAGSFNPADIEDIDNLSPLYRNSIPQADNFQGTAPPAFDNPGYVPGTNGLRFGPQGGLRTNLEGMLTFGNLLINYGVHEGVSFLDSTTVAEMMLPQWTYTGNNGDNFFGLFNSWGLGIHRSLGITGNGSGDAVFPGTVMYGHPGEAYGLLSDLYVHPETGFVLAFLTNGYTVAANYAFGSTTTFYAVEEAVFSAFEESAWAACQTVASTEETERAKACRDIYCDARTGLLYNTGEAPVQFEVYSSSGKCTERGILHHSHEPKSEASGIYVVRILRHDGRTCVLKTARF